MTDYDLQAAIVAATEELDDARGRIHHCVRQLSPEQLWWRPADDMNAVGNLMLHLMGNVRQWLIAGLLGSTDVRQRTAEFSRRDPLDADDLMRQLDQTVDESIAAIHSAALTMSRRRRIQGFDVTGWEALFSSIAHFRGHTQEIIYITRLQLGSGYQFAWRPATPEQGA